MKAIIFQFFLFSISFWKLTEAQKSDYREDNFKKIDSDSSEGDGSHSIVGIIVGSIVSVLILGLCIGFCCWRRKKLRKNCRNNTGARRNNPSHGHNTRAQQSNARAARSDARPKRPRRQPSAHYAPVGAESPSNQEDKGSLTAANLNRRFPAATFEHFKTSFAQTTCSICLEELQIGMVCRQLYCEHIFHSECVKLWLENQLSKGNAHCPNCNKSVMEIAPKAQKKSFKPISIEVH